MKRLLPRLLAVLVGVLVGLLLAEGLVRLIMPDPGAVKAVRNLRAGDRSHGGAAAARPKQGQLRIAFLGDSYVYGQGVEFSDVFSVRAAEILRRERPGLEVETLNFGNPGAAADDELRTLRREILPRDPDIVVLGFVLNDFTYRQARVAFSRVYKKEKGKYLPFRRLERFSRLAYFLDWTFFQLFSDMDRIHEDYLSGLYDPQRNPEFDRLATALDEMLGLLAERRGIVLFFPMFVRGEAGRPFYQAGLQLVREACRRRGVSFVELLPHFSGRSPDKWWASLEDHHPNAAAHAVVARVLSEIILKEKL